MASAAAENSELNMKIFNDDECEDCQWWWTDRSWSHKCWDGHAIAAVGITYQVVQCTTRHLDQTLGLKEEDDQYPEPVWAHNSSTSQDFLNFFMLSDEAIIEVMTGL